MTDPFTIATVIIGTLATGLVLGLLLMALGARTRQMDDESRASRAWQDLLDAALRCVAPDRRADLMREAGRIRDTWLPALGLSAPAARTPEYVHRLLDALTTGKQPMMGGCWVPQDVRDRLVTILATSGATTTPLPPQRAYTPGGPVDGATTAVVLATGDLPLIRPRSDG
jgi:hypothetical protein